MGEVKGIKLSTRLLDPDFAAISIGVLPPCYVIKQREISYISQYIEQKESYYTIS